MLILGHAVGWRLYGPRNKLIAERTSRVDLPAHHQNFFDCIRGRQKQLAADIAVGHLAASIVHLANISTRLGRMLHFDPKTEQFRGDEEATAMVRRKYRKEHWAIPKNL